MASEVACGQIGRNCGAFAPYFFDFSLSSPVETVFKGVQFVHITLSLDPKGDRWHLSVLPTIAVFGCITHMGEGVLPLCSYAFFPSPEKWLTPIIARIGEYTQAEAYLQEGLDLAFMGGLHPGENRFGVLDVALVGQLFVVNVGDFDVDVDAVQHWSADLLLVAGDGHDATTALFDRVAVEAAGAGVRIAAASTFLYDLCTCLDKRLVEKALTNYGYSENCIL